MKKILGLDIGTNSIGWALVHEPTLDGETYAIAGMGVRIIPLSSDENDEFTKGNAMSKNAGRTQKRGARRNLQRYKLRRHQLTALLKGLGMMPDKELFEIDALTLYGLRAKGVTEQLTLQEIGRVFYHLNQKRGYKSNRKANNDEEQTDSKATGQTDDTDARQKKKGYLDYINDREQALKDEGITIGQHFYKLLLERETAQTAEAVRIKENIYLRSSYMDEFDRIWDKQQTYYPDVLTEANKQKIRNETIYYQRPLRSQKGLVSNCLFEKYHKAAPKSSPLFQVSKIWQELNNIELTSFKAMRGREDGFDAQGKRKLTLDEKQRMFQLLNVKGKLTTKECLKELGYQSGFDEYKLNIRNEKELEGNRTYSAIKKIFDKFKVDDDRLLQFNLAIDQKETADKQTGEIFIQQQINAAFEQEPLFQLWHLLYSVEENETLIAKLQGRYAFTEELAKALAKIDFTKQGYGSLSHKSIRNILPYLTQGLMYSKSCDKVRTFRIFNYMSDGKSKLEAEKMASYNHSNSLTEEQNTNRKLDDQLELIEKNTLRQPVVEKILNQVINLINQIIDEKNGLITNEERHNGNFEIRVELARELRQNAEERNKTFKNNSAANKEHNRIVKELKEDFGFKHVSRSAIEKYKLYKQFDGISIYSGLGMSLAKCLNGDGYDVDHIIPQAIFFDDSFQNKVLCELEINRCKDKTTGYDFMKTQSPDKFNGYVNEVKRLFETKKISKSKRDRLLMTVDEIPQDFINRQMNETRFISKEVKKHLQKICYHVHSSSGIVTSRLRHLWGWDDILMNLQISHYRSVGQTEWVEFKKDGQIHRVERIKDWTKREDHRHHAIDALTVACTQQGFIHRMNTLNSQHTRDEMFAEIPNPLYKKRLSLLENYLISKKPFETSAIENIVSNVLTSFKTGKRLFSKNKIKGHEEKEPIIIPRGFLHKEKVYGRIKQFESIRLSSKFNKLEFVAEPEKKVRIIEHLKKFDNDVKKAFNNKNLSEFIEQYKYDTVTVYYFDYVIKYRLDTTFKLEHVESIVDEGVKKKVREHLNKYGNNPKEAFKMEHTLWLNQEKGIPIKTVRRKVDNDDLRALHKNEKNEPIDFVVIRNNHHIAIYRDENGKLQENTVSFWDAVKRRQAKLPIIIKEPAVVWDAVINSGFDDQELMKGLPQPNWIYQTSLQQNEMFVFGLTEEELELAINNNNNALISKHLYRTQKMSKKSSGAIDLWFRHHLETKLDDSATAKELKKYINIASLGAMNGIKVKVNNIGQIVRA